MMTLLERSGTVPGMAPVSSARTRFGTRPAKNIQILAELWRPGIFRLSMAISHCLNSLGVLLLVIAKATQPSLRAPFVQFRLNATCGRVVALFADGRFFRACDLRRSFSAAAEQKSTKNVIALHECANRQRLFMTHDRMWPVGG